ncbi:hypothetical protein Agub_g15866, partial [Astrephomene gubernaculifera]
MDASLSRLYARALDTPSGKCFCLVRWGPDVDEFGFDVTLLHARSMRTFVGKGLRAPTRWIKPDLWIPLAQRALACEGQPADVNFQFNPDTGALYWTWSPQAVGMDTAAQQSLSLTPLPPPGEGQGQGGPLEEMLGTVWESCYRLMVCCRQLDSQLAAQSGALAGCRRELQAAAEEHKGALRELHVKFALVLDAKKERLVAQHTRIQQLEQQLRAAQQELAEAEALQTEGEEEAEEGEQQGQGQAEAEQQRRQRQGQGLLAGLGPTTATTATTTAQPAAPLPRTAAQAAAAAAGQEEAVVAGGPRPAPGLPPPAAPAPADPMQVDGGEQRGGGGGGHPFQPG